MTVRYVLNGFWKKGTFTGKECLIGLVLCLMINSVIDLPIAFIFGRYSRYVRTLILLVMMELILFKRIKAIAKHPIFVFVLMICSLMLNFFMFFIVAGTSTQWTENRYVAKDLENTIENINKFTKKNEINKAKREATHLLNLYQSYFGKYADETDEIRKLIAIKIDATF